ncbi:MAG: hypothetical protein RLP09_25420 [Sandaracinaceae bacterium]
MRSILLCSQLTCLAALTALPACGGEEEAEAEITAIGEPTSLEVAAGPPPAPQHGGTVVVAGPHPVEVVPHSNGEVEAFFVAEPPEPSAAQLTVNVTTNEGPRPVMLVWDPGQSRFRGALSGAQIVEGPTEVTLLVRGETYRATAPTVVIVTAPAAPAVVVNRPSRSRTVVVERPEPPSATVVVNRPRPPGATVVVERPGRPHVDVRVRAPEPPRARVVVERPAPPRVEVRAHAPRPPRGRVVVQHRGGGRAHVRARRGGRGHGRHRGGDDDDDD